MPPGRYSSQDTFDLEILSPQALDTPNGLTAALRAIEAVCQRGDPKVIAEIVEALNNHSHILEYIISGTSPTPIGSYELLTSIILLSSAGRGSIQEALEVDNHGIPHIHNTRCDGYHEYTAPTEILIFAAIRGILSRCTLQSPRISEKGGTLVRCSGED